MYVAEAEGPERTNNTGLEEAPPSSIQNVANAQQAAIDASLAKENKSLKEEIKMRDLLIGILGALLAAALIFVYLKR